MVWKSPQSVVLKLVLMQNEACVGLQDVSIPFVRDLSWQQCLADHSWGWKTKEASFVWSIHYSPRSASQGSDSLHCWMWSVLELCVGVMGRLQRWNVSFSSPFLYEGRWWAARCVCFLCIGFQKPLSKSRVLLWLAACIQRAKMSPVWKCYAVPFPSEKRLGQKVWFESTMLS